VHSQRPDVRFLVACFSESQREFVGRHIRDRNLPMLACAGRTPEIIHLSHACVAVSGSVGLELLYAKKPSAVVYKVSHLDMGIVKLLMTTPYISLVNILAAKELFPEFLSAECQARAVADHVLKWLHDKAAYETICAELAELKHRVARPGACARAAHFVISTITAARAASLSPADRVRTSRPAPFRIRA
jgi:lipid-A-disaccharide synthase